MIHPEVVVVHTNAPADCPFQVGDRVTVMNGQTVWKITRLWQETFHGGPQWVARLVGGPNDMSMRIAHLRAV